MADWKKSIWSMGMVVAAGIWIGSSAWIACAEEPQSSAAAPSIAAPANAPAESTLDEEADVENLVSIQGEVTAVDPKANTVAIKDSSVKDAAAATKTLTIDPKTTTIWGEYDEIKLTDLAVGSKVAGEYKQNPNGTLTATYLEIVLDEEAELPPVEETNKEDKSKPAENPVE